MTNEEKKLSKELSSKADAGEPMTDEELKEYQEKDARKTNRVLGVFSAIWETILMFFS